LDEQGEADTSLGRVEVGTGTIHNIEQISMVATIKPA